MWRRQAHEGKGRYRSIQKGGIRLGDEAKWRREKKDIGSINISHHNKRVIISLTAVERGSKGIKTREGRKAEELKYRKKKKGGQDSL